VPDGKVIWLEELCFQLEFTYLWKEKRKKTIIRYKNKLKMQKKKKKKKLMSFKNIDFTLADQSD
jgi:hypothetical protein